MVEDGSLVTLIAPTVSNSTGKWLETNITNPSNPPIDKSLTVENAAADAKIVGDKITANTERSTKNSTELYYAKENEITVNVTEYSLLENKVAYIDTTNKIATYDNTAAFVLKKMFQTAKNIELNHKHMVQYKLYYMLFAIQQEM